MKHAVTLIVALFILSSLTVSGASAHVKGPGSDAESGVELEIQDLTQYDDQRMWAIARWDALSPVWVLAWNGGTIDLVWNDYNDCNTTTQGYYQQRSGAGLISMNICELKVDTLSAVRNTATHEVGHALGPSHSFSGEIMYANQSSITYLQTHDLCSYNVYWNGESPLACGDPI